MIGAVGRGATVRVAYGGDRVNVSKTRAQKDGLEIQGEVDGHNAGGQSVQVSWCRDSARWCG